jgi:type VI secretion system protein ImpF
MNDALAQERLQPSLFDRLIDEEPDHSIESDDKRTLTRAALRQAVLRDLGWLLNATGHGLAFDDPRHPHAARSVLNYGLPMLSGQFTSSIQRVSMEQALKQAIVQLSRASCPKRWRWNSSWKARPSNHTTASVSRFAAPCGRNRCRWSS